MFQEVTTPTMILYLIALLLTLLMLTLFVLLIHSGIFSQIDEIGTGKPPIGQVILAYRFLKGPYNQSGQTFTEAAMIAPDNKTLGIYYDDPSKVQSKNLRYVVGSILSSGSDPVPEDLVKTFTAEGFKILHLPEVTYAVRTKFPHITSLSILIGIYKAYPCLKEYIAEHKLCAYPFLEYYDGESIHFMAPLSKQEEFFVPEITQAYGDDTLGSTLDSSQSTGVSTSLLSATLGSAYTTHDSLLNETGNSLGDTTDASQLNTTQGSQSDTEASTSGKLDTPLLNMIQDGQDMEALSKSTAPETNKDSCDNTDTVPVHGIDNAEISEASKLRECPIPASEGTDFVTSTGEELLKDGNNSNVDELGGNRRSDPDVILAEDELATSDDSSCSFEVIQAEASE